MKSKRRELLYSGDPLDRVKFDHTQVSYDNIRARTNRGLVGMIWWAFDPIIRTLGVIRSTGETSTSGFETSARGP